MAIVIKLREYKADQEGPEPVSPVRILAGCGIGLVLVGMAYFFLATEGAPAAHASSARAVASGPGGAQGTTDFGRTNWGYLPQGEMRPRSKALDTDLECPEWEGREDLKGLKAMAVYEVKTPDREPEESVRMAEEIFGVKG